MKNREEVIIKLVQKESFNEEYTLVLNIEKIIKQKIKGTVSIP